MKPVLVTLAVLSGIVAIVLLAVGTAQWVAIALIFFSLTVLVTTPGGAAGAASSD